MKIRNYHICIAFFCLIFSSCKSQQTVKENSTIFRDMPKVYQTLSQTYSDKLLLTSINSIYNRVKLNINDAIFDFPDIYELDSLNDATKIKVKLLSFFNLHDSIFISKKIKNWCDSYLLLDAFLNANPNIYFEEIAIKDRRFSIINHYFMTKGQDINSLSSSQSQMLYLDFSNFLSNYPINERVSILNNAIKSKNW
jgi:hypothetical protein